MSSATSDSTDSTVKSSTENNNNDTTTTVILPHSTIERLFPITTEVPSLSVISTTHTANTLLHISGYSIEYAHLSYLRQWMCSIRDKYCPSTSYNSLTRCNSNIIDLSGNLGFNTIALIRRKEFINNSIVCESNTSIRECCINNIRFYGLNDRTTIESMNGIEYLLNYYQLRPESASAVIYWDLELPIQSFNIRINDSKNDYTIEPSLKLSNNTNNNANTIECSSLLSFIQYLFSSPSLLSCCMIVIKSSIHFQLTDEWRSIAQYCIENRKLSPNYLFVAFCGRKPIQNTVITDNTNTNTNNTSTSTAPIKQYINVYNNPAAVPAYSGYQLHVLADTGNSTSVSKLHLYQRLKQLFASQLYGCHQGQKLLWDEFNRIIKLRKSNNTNNTNTNRTTALFKPIVLPETKQYQSLLNDEELYDELRDYYHRVIVPSDEYKKLKSAENSSGRANSRVTELVDLIHTAGLSPQSPGFQLLDLGCSEGSITAALGSSLNLSSSSVHGCDIRPMKSNTGFTFTVINENDPVLPYQTGEFNLILALMSLHHIETVHQSLNEIHRLLKPNGVLLIREHDCSIHELSMLIDVMHGLYARVWSNPPEQPAFCDSYWAHYRSRLEWIKLLNNTGFTQLIQSPDTEQNYRSTFDLNRWRPGQFIKNPYGFYYGLYRKSTQSTTSSNNQGIKRSATSTAVNDDQNEKKMRPNAS